MAAPRVCIMSISLKKCFNSFKCSPSFCCKRYIDKSPVLLSPRQFSATTAKHDLMEFFDTKANWGETTVKTGRPWKMDELRIKSNEDLHKLWYVLLKERNMLMTMEAEYKRLCELFPSPERIFKVEESMENLQGVVAERDSSVNLLETGQTGEPEVIERNNFFGLPHRYPKREYALPRELNRMHNILYPRHRRYMDKFVVLYNEKKVKDEATKRFRRKLYWRKVKEAFPHAEVDDV